jgi:hypothetical protein
MNGGTSAERVRQEIVRLCHAGLDSRTFRVEAVRHLRKAIPVDASFFATADPATLLFTGAVLDDVHPQFLENEFLKDDSVKFASLTRECSPVDSLGMATRGELARSPRYQDILAPMDLGDELRAALIVGSKCWGSCACTASGTARTSRPARQPSWRSSPRTCPRACAPPCSSAMRKIPPSRPTDSLPEPLVCVPRTSPAGHTIHTCGARPSYRLCD